MTKIFCKLFLMTAIIFCANIFSVHAQPPEYSLPEETVAQILAKTQTAQKTNQILLVVNHNFSTWYRTADGWWARDADYYCGLGKNGLSANRHAGDKTTPIGSFKILYAFGKAQNPGTQMLYRDITPYSYLSSEYDTYNTWVESPYRRMSGEHLTDYYQYKYGMDIGFNQNPVVYGKGAAIFLHCKSYDRWWTAGCISLEEPDMVHVLQFTQNGAYMIIVPRIEDIARY